MDEISFPSQYKKALLTKTKDTTIRVGKEIGRYKVGKTYSARSYAGTIWNIKIKILSISQTRWGRLSDFGIPEQSIEAIQKKEKIALDTKVELVRFEVL